MRTRIENVKIVTSERVIENGSCVFANGVISYVGMEKREAERVIDGNGLYLIAGFIDLHCHGGNGVDFMDATVEEYEAAAKFHLLRGTTTMLATTLAASEKETDNS